MKTSARDNIRSISGGVQFSVDIRYQQNNSWQGSVQRLDTGESVYFRSETGAIKTNGTGSPGKPITLR